MILCPWATRFTLYGERDYTNKKPYRNKYGKKQARKDAVKNKNGSYTAHTHVAHHPSAPFTPSKTQVRHFERFKADCK